MNSKIHIVPCDGEWAIRFPGSEEPAAIHPTQQAAIEDAMELARDEELDIVVHRRDGTFRNVINYDAIELRAAEQGRLHARHLAWGLFAAGALAAVAAYVIVRPPVDTRRLLRRLDDHRPDWMKRN